MRSKILLLAALAVLTTVAAPAASRAGGMRRVPVIVTLTHSASPRAIAALEQSVGRVTVRRRFHVIPAFAASMTERQARALSRRPGVARVESDRIVHALNDTSEASFGVTKARFDDPALDGQGLAAAVIDTGIDSSHADLDGGKVIAFVDCTVGVTCIAGSPFDDNGHGTHVSATLAGDGDGTADHRYLGVAPKASLVGVKVLGANGMGDESDLIAGIDWVVGHPGLGVRVINLSLGGPPSAISAAVDGAVAAGYVVAVAAGNSGPGAGTIGSPGDAGSAITVGAMADLGPSAADCGRSFCRNGFKEAPFSSRGPTSTGLTKPDISAPGVSITSAAATTGNGYTTLSGTSMATPFVAGVALLLLDQNPSLTPAQVKSTLMSTAVDWGPPGADNTYGAGRLDAYAALAAGGAPIASPPAVPGHVSLAGTLPAIGGLVDLPFVAAGSTFPFAATLLAPAGQVTLTLLDASGTAVAQSAFGGTTADEQQELGLPSLAAGAYTLRIISTGGVGPYSLDLSGQVSLGPRNLSPPAISGLARHGSKLTAVPGGWVSALPLGSYTFAWLRCDTAGNGCAAIPGATAAVYTAQRSDVGRTLRVAVTASSSAGSATAASNAVRIGALKPQSRTAPSIRGRAKVGRVLRASPGRWSGSAPFRFRYLWLRCGARCHAIPGAMHPAYRVRLADLRKRLRLRVTASNSRLPAGGSVAKTSAPTARVRR